MQANFINSTSKNFVRVRLMVHKNNRDIWELTKKIENPLSKKLTKKIFKTIIKEIQFNPACS